MTEPDDLTRNDSSAKAVNSTDPYALHDPELDLPPDLRASRPTRKETIQVGVRTVAALAGVGVAVVVVAAATIFSGPTLVTRVPGIVVTPAAAAQQRVCPGPIQTASDSANPTFSSTGDVTPTYRATSGTIFTDRLTTAADVANAGPLRLTLPPRGDVSALLAGSESQVLATPSLSGLAVAECAQSSGDSWLVGGSTDIGRSTLLLVSNPSTVPATVAVEVFGELGKVSAPGMAGLVVAPGALRVFSLAGFAPGLVSPVVHVSSRGGQVVASLQQTTVRTLQPGGIDLVGVAQAPSRNSTIPGLVLRSTAAVTAAQGSAGYGDLEATVRLLLPGRVDATVTVTITAEEGSAAPAAPAAASSNDDAAPADASTGEVPPGSAPARGATRFTVSLVAGRVTDVPLPGLEDGSYLVTVAAAQPVVAAARSSVIDASTASDFVWLSTAGPLSARQLVSVATGPSPSLHFANSGTTPRTVTVVDGESSRAVVVPARGGSSIPVPAGDSILLTGAGGLTASVLFMSDTLAAGFTVSPPDAGSRPITVYR